MTRIGFLAQIILQALLVSTIRNPKNSIITHRLLSSSFLGLPYRILHINHKRNYLGAYE